MILRKLKWSLVLHLVYLAITVQSQNSRSYDTNDWIPIAPSPEENKEQTVKRATGRVLNLNEPQQQKFFPDDDHHYRKRRPQPPHFNGQKDRFNVQKYDNEYEFVVPPQQIQKGPINHQYFPTQGVRLANFEQPPPAQYNNHFASHTRPAVPPPRDRAPPPGAPSIYEQYNIAQNNTASVYETISPSSVNQELIGAIQNNPIELGAPQVPPAAGAQKTDENVQLVYVPLENLNQNQPLTQGSQNIYRQTASQQLIPEPSKQHRLQNIQNDFLTQALQAHKLQEQIQLGEPLEIQTTTTTTVKPGKKRKPHQPPLAVYLETENNGNVDDVLEALKDAKTIAVQDTVSADSPQIFIGPSSLSVPEGYSRYPLPYLNSLDGNRLEKKIDHLPFFVAPLSFKAPPGYSKIALPSPHVGSVVISTKNPINDKRSTPKANQVNQARPIKETYYSTPKPTLSDNFLQPSIDTQDYYNPGHGLVSSQPNYLQLGINNNLRQVSTTPSAYLQPQEIFGRPLTYYPTDSQLNDYQVPQENSSPRPQELSTVQKAPTESSDTQYTQGSSGETYVQPVRTGIFQLFDQEKVARPQEHTTKHFETPTRVRSSTTPRSPTVKYEEATTKTPRRTPQRTRYTTTSNVDSKEHYETSTENVRPRTTTTPVHSGTQPIIHNFYAEEPQPEQKPVHANISPLELAINEFELHQINTQLGGKPKPAQTADEVINIKPSTVANFEHQVQTGRPTEANNLRKFKTKSTYGEQEENQPNLKESYEYQYQTETPEVATSRYRNTYSEQVESKPNLKESYEYQYQTEKPEIPTSRYKTTQFNSREQLTPEIQPAQNYQQPNGKPDSENTFPSTVSQYHTRYTNPLQLEEQPKPNLKESYEFPQSQTPRTDSIAESDYQLSNKYKSPNSFNEQLQQQFKQQHKDTLKDEIYTEKPDYKDNYSGFDPQLHRFANTPASILRDTGIETKPSTVPTQKSRRRGRPTRPPTTTSQESLKETYTVLEEFSAKQTSTTPQYYETTRKEDTNIYSSISSTPKFDTLEETRLPQYERNPSQYGTSQNEAPNFYNQNQNRNSPASTEQLIQPQISSQPERNPELQLSQFGISSPEFPPQQVNNYFSPPRYNQEQAIEPLVHNRGRKPDYVEQKPSFDSIGSTQNRQEVSQYSQEINQYNQGADPYNLNQNSYQQGSNEYQQSYESNDEMSDIVKSLQDPSIRSLLVPKLLAPTTDNAQRYKPPVEITTPYYTTTTTTTTTTEKPTEYTTVTTTRSRGRQRGSSRFAQSNTTTRKSIPRRRPTQSTRTTTVRPTATTEYSDYQRSTKQRFRTRGRTTPNLIASRISTTENEVSNGPTSEAVVDFQKTPQSHYEHVPSEAVIKPSPDQIQQYHQEVIQPIQQEHIQPVAQYEHQVPQTSTSGLYLQLNDPETAEKVVSNIAPVLKESRGHTRTPPSTTEYEETTKHNFRVRGRGRARTRPSTTTERITTRRIIATAPPALRQVPSQNSEKEEEFYGFIRQPNFKASLSQIEVASATQQPQYYSDSNQFVSPTKDYKLSYDNTNFETTTLKFVGEIKPKYPATRVAEANLDAPKPTRRTRIRTNPKKSYDTSSPRNHRPTYNDHLESTTRRTNVIRTRGRTHYKPPVGNERTKSDEEADVEGGNYPKNFFQQKQAQGSASSAPGFQIAIGPPEEHDEEEDQAPNSSIYRPTVVKPEEWHEATADEAIAPDNDIQETAATESEPFTTEHEPVALAVKASEPIGINTESTEDNSGTQTTEDSEITSTTTEASKIEETFKENAEAMEELFEKATTIEKSTEKAKGRRRGVWKLVKHKPLDHIEASESQNYYTVLNMFDEIKKDEISKGNQKEFTGLSFERFNNFNPVLEQNSDTYDYESRKVNTEEPSTTTEFVKEETTRPDFNQDGTSNTEHQEDQETTTLVSSTTVHETKPSTEEVKSLYDSFYSMFGFSGDTSGEGSLTTTSSSVENKEESFNTTTTNENPTFPDEITENSFDNSRNVTESSIESGTTQEVPTTTKSDEHNRAVDVQPWEMKKVRTSTSTEVSHETEICYKGKCVKSKKRKIKV